ncbi:hypothetical protein Catovirus_1_38 [Catovirus CTV1]|uniref:Uncharacterized protein n=1 Tax=Catovirus CTV1 TaxID=1977631 RepID=A0A1V0S8L9_9VIRU|nr:hypothetical protein Catovirus_1_38 [Catovirus CTV1]
MFNSKINKWCIFDEMTGLKIFSGKKILNKNIIIQNISFDDHMISNHPKFSEAENVVVYNCDKNYVYYYIKDDLFPKINNLYLISHPCEPAFFSRFNNSNQKIFLADYYKSYQSRWAPEKENLFIFNAESYHACRQNFVDEQVKI